ncbi:MAG: TonB-dependent receptor, partial [Photobacterium aquimaris]|nr:TonB-dependent receptor [Photobacterium aquimaris]
MASSIAIITSSTQVFAEKISGLITNSKGTVISGATVKVMGSNISVLTDKHGKFDLTVEPGKHELHVTAKSFVHKSVHIELDENQSPELSVQLDKSAIEIMDVTATPFHSSNIESALPVTVLHGESLRMRQANTLGDTLNKEVGVHSNYHGGVASTPIIRGLDGPRVLITQNGLDAGDASRVGPDHVVSTET